jgi:hypothetical protein
MKNFFFSVAMLCSAFSFGQELAVDRVDDFTGSIVRKTKYYKFGHTSYGAAHVAVARVDDDVFFEVWTTSDLGCGGAVGNYVTFLYGPGISKSFNEDLLDINCDNRASSMYLISDADVEGITKMRVKQSEHYQDFTFDGVYSLSELYDAVHQ